MTITYNPNASPLIPITSTTRTVEEIEESIKSISGDPLIATATENLKKAKENPYISESGLAKAQKTYDAAMTYRDQSLAMYFAELDLATSRDRAAAEKKLAEERQAAAEFDQRLKPELRRAWLEAGGEPDTFEDAYPALKQNHIMQNMGKKRETTGRNVAREVFSS